MILRIRRVVSIDRSYWKCRKKGRVQAGFRFRKKDGTYFSAEEIGGSAFWMKTVKPTDSWSNLRDYYQRKTTKKLEISEKKYRSFIHDFKGIAFQLDENLVPEFIQRTVEEITGYTKEGSSPSGSGGWISSFRGPACS